MELRIAIPTDFSPAAEKAARYTLELFRDVPCVFFLMHSYTPSFFRAEYLLHSPGQIGLGDFYRSLLKSEARHYQDYLKLAREYAEGPIDERIEFFARAEALAVVQPDDEFRFHSGAAVEVV